MATLKELYKLVHALDKNEKKNLSIMIEAMGGKARQRYANSLRIINDQKEFDAEKLKNKLTADVSGMNLAEANGYFFNFICKSLISQQTPTSGNLGFLRDLTLVETFVAKGLFDMADKHLQPLLQKLESGNSFGLLVRAQELHSIVTASNPRTNLDFKKRLSVAEQRATTAYDHVRHLKILRLNNHLTEIIHKNGDPRQKSDLQAYEAIYKDPVWKTPYEEVSKTSFIMYAPLRVDMVNLEKGDEASIKEAQTALKEFHKRFTLEDHYQCAFYLLDSIASNCVRTKDAAGLASAITELQKLLPYAKYQAVNQKIQARIMFSELTIHIVKGSYSQGAKIAEEWMHSDRKAIWEDAPLAYMNYLLAARVHYLNRNSDKAMDYLFTLRDIEKHFRASMLVAYQFLTLVCHYKLNNYSLTLSTANSIYKSLLKQKKLHAPERAILRFAKSCGSVEKLQNGMKQLYITLHELSKDPLNKSFFDYGDYLEWVKMERAKKK